MPASRAPIPPSPLVGAAPALVLPELFGSATTRADSETLRDVLAVDEERGELLVAGLTAATVLCVAGRREGEATPAPGHE